MGVNEKLSKSLEEIEALADEILSKSEETVELEKSEEVSEVDEESVELEKSEEVSGEESGEIEKGIKADDVSNDAEESDDSDNSDDASDDGDDEEEETQKSFADVLNENEIISKALDVSDFLGEFTKENAHVIDNLREDVAKSLETSAHTANILAKSFNAIMKSQSEIVKSISDLNARLDQVERQPVGRKATVNVVEKSFKHSASISGNSLSKSQISEKLTQLAMSGKIPVGEVISFESTGTLKPELEALINE